MRRTPIAIFLAIALLGICRAAAADPSGIGFQPKPGARLPLAVALTDEEGRLVRLARFFTGKPVVVVLEYLRCKILCGITLRNIVTAIDAMSLRLGTDFQVAAIDIDPRDGPADAAAAKAKYLSGHDRPATAGGFHFLTGPEAAVRQIADAVGFSYRYDPDLDQYLHPAGFVVAAADGTVSQYFFGIDASSPQLAAAIADAGENRAPALFRRVLLLCGFGGTPTGRFTVPVLAAFALANILAMAALVALFAGIRRLRDR
jgi:protein SCO1/2